MSVALRDVRTAKRAALTCDVGRIQAEETLLATGSVHLYPPTKPAKDDPDAAQPAYQAQLLVWERVRELVQKAQLEPYAKEIVYGSPLLRGFLPKRGWLLGSAESGCAPWTLKTTLGHFLSVRGSCRTAYVSGIEAMQAPLGDWSGALVGALIARLG
jgi:hypothetical protein